MGLRSRVSSSSRAQAQTDHVPTFLTGLLLWLCALPLVGLLILPWFGTRVAVATALGLLLAAMAACYAICSWQAYGRGGKEQS